MDERSVTRANAKVSPSPTVAKEVLSRSRACMKERQDLLSKSEQSDKVIGNLCTFGCNTCHEEFKSQDWLKRHFKTTGHEQMDSNRSILSYATRIVSHKCKICSMWIMCELKTLQKHFHRYHKLNLVEYCRQAECMMNSVQLNKTTSWQDFLRTSEVTDKIGNLCRFKCMFCEKKTKNWSSMLKHIGEQHKSSSVKGEAKGIENYLHKCVLYKCPVCQEKILCDRVRIKRHAGTSHNLKMPSFLEMAKQLNPQVEVINESDSEESESEMAKAYEQIEIGNLCIFECPKCKKGFNSICTLSTHFKKLSHGSLKQGAKGAANAILYASKLVHHKCHLCSKAIVCELTYLSSHMKTHHKMSLDQYCYKTGCKRKSAKMDCGNLSAELRGNLEMSDEVGNLCDFKCKHCGLSFDSWQQTRLHITKIHTNEKSWGALEHLSKGFMHQCTLCSEKILCDKTFITNHLRYNHGGCSFRRYQKRICPKNRNAMKSDIGAGNENNLHLSGSSSCSDSEGSDAEIWGTRNKQSCRIKQAKPTIPILIKEECLSQDIIGNLCVFECPKCKRQFQSLTAMYGHFDKSRHVLGHVKNKVRRFGKKLVYHRCHFCSKLVICETSRLSAHFNLRHNIRSTAEYCSKTNCKYQTKRVGHLTNWTGHLEEADITESIANLCKYRCKFCDHDALSFEDMVKHLKTHGKANDHLNVEEYLLKRTFHKCKLCSKKVLCDKRYIRYHLRTHHDISSLQRYVSSTGASYSYKTHSEGKNALKSLAVKSPLPISKTLDNLCVFSCNSCSVTATCIRGIYEHLKKTHGSHNSTAKGNRYSISKATSYLCQLCNKTVLCDRRYFQSHLRHNHPGVTLTKYGMIAKSNLRMIISSESEESDLD